MYVVYSHKNHLVEAILMRTLTIPLFYRRLKRRLKSFSFASKPGAMINPQCLELPMSRTHFHGSKEIRAVEIRLSKETVA